MADRAESAIALAAGNPEEAAGHALAAAGLADEIAAPVHAAACRMLAGRALVAARRPDEAARELERAAADFESLGASRYREQAEAELRAFGRDRARRLRSDGSGVGRLTERELEVAQLVLDRCTNREIAERLFLSLKTVETHIHNIFNKLGVDSRVEVARALARAGLVETPTA